MLRILIADDHEIVRRGIKQILLEGFTFVEIGEAYDTTSLIDKALNDNWDIIISDISMPGGGGLSALPIIREKKPKQQILILSIYPEEQYAVRSISSGASGFLNKEAATDELLKAVATILAGRKYVHPVLAEKMSGAQQKQAGLLPHELLSERELEVFIKLASGFPVTEIARQLSLSVNTVSTYRLRVMDKMDMKSNADLMRYVIENKLVL